MIFRILLFLLWLFVWLLLSWPPAVQQIILGMFVSAFVSFMTIDLLSGEPKPMIRPSRYLWFVYYIAVFVWECVKANIDVAYRVIHPALPIRPATVKVKMNLKSDTGITFLANSITLTPGTTAVDVDKENGFIYIHRLYVRPGCDIYDLPVVGRFENILKRIFE